MTKKTQTIIGVLIGLFAISTTVANYLVLPKQLDEIGSMVRKDHDKLTEISVKIEHLTDRLNRNGILRNYYYEMYVTNMPNSNRN